MHRQSSWQRKWTEAFETDISALTLYLATIVWNTKCKNRECRQENTEFVQVKSFSSKSLTNGTSLPCTAAHGVDGDPLPQPPSTKSIATSLSLPCVSSHCCHRIPIETSVGIRDTPIDKFSWLHLGDPNQRQVPLRCSRRMVPGSFVPGTYLIVDLGERNACTPP